MKSSYYELRCAVVEMFYETLLEEGYSIGQATSRCLVEFRREVQGGGQEGLIVLSALLSRPARHEPAALAGFEPEWTALRALGKKAACWKGIDGSAKERLKEDLRYVLERAGMPENGGAGA
jgi:hypothetical protein